MRRQGGGSAAEVNGKGKAAGRPPIMTIRGTPRGLTSMAISHDGGKVAITGRDGILRIHDLSSGILLTGFKVRTYLEYMNQDNV